MRDTRPVLIMAGGTGGHVFPALAVARELRAHREQVVWLGTRAGIEARLVPGDDFPIEWVRVAGLRRKGALAWLLAPLRLGVALYDALRVVARRNPKVVLGMGGFASGPGGVAAWLLRRPLLIHEQNAVAGLTNRLLASIAREVLQAFPGSFAGRDATVTGNPVRADIAALPEPSQRLAGRHGRLRVLVVGGSQGALALNETVPAALALLPEPLRPEVLHQSGESTAGAARSAYREAGIEARVETFIDDMASAYGWADLVVCRAGALTIAELAAAGIGAVLVPYPAAVDDHQTRNGEYLVRAGAAVLIPQAELDPPRLAAEIRRCCEDRALVLERARAARAVAWPDATRVLAERCIALAATA